MTKANKSPELTRRSFLKGAAVGVAGLAAASAMTSSDTWLKPCKAMAQENEKIAYTFHNMHCMGNCMLECTIRDDRLVNVVPRPNDDERFHNICLKGIAEIEHIYGNSRIQSPMKRVGERGSGEFEVITWDEAISTIADEFKKCQDKYGKDSLWIQTSVESANRLAPILPAVLGAQAGGLSGLDNGQANGMGQAFGWPGIFALNTIWDWPFADTVILTSNNMLETGIVWARGYLDAQKAGTKLIVVDPYFTVTAQKADQWIPVQPGTDPALYLGMINHILKEELYDKDHILKETTYPYLVDKETGELLGEMVDVVDEETGEVTKTRSGQVWDTSSSSVVSASEASARPALSGNFDINGKKYVTVFDLLQEQMGEYTTEWAESITLIPASTIEELAEQYASGPSIIANGVGGIDKYWNNDVAGHCYAVLASLTNNYGRRGTGLGFYQFNPTPYNAALGGWKLPEGYAPAPSPVAFYDLMSKENNVHAAMFFGDVPTQKAGNWNETLEWINTLDFICLADIYHSSVADFCDIILPVCSKFESIDEFGGMRCFNGYVMTNEKMLDPLFDSLPDFYIEKRIAEELGVADLFPKDTVEYCEAYLAPQTPPIKGITLETLKENKGAQLINADWSNPLADPVGPSLTPSGKQEPYYENMIEFGQAFPRWEAPIEAGIDNPLREKYPLQFNQARSRFRVHSAYSGAEWIQQLYEPHIAINPEDAESRGIKIGDEVEVFNERGSFKTKAHVSNAVRPGSAFMAESTYRRLLDYTLMQSVSNNEMNPRGYAEPFGPMIPFNDTLVEIVKAGA